MHSDRSTDGSQAGQHGPDAGKTASRVVLFALGAALLIGLALAGLLAWAAVPQSALFGSARTPSMARPASEVAVRLNDLYNAVSWIAAITYILVQGLILYAAFGFRRKSEDDAEPPQTHGNNTLEVAWTVIPSIIVLVLAFLSFREMRAEYVTDVPDDLVITATGYRWYWAFDYADKTIGDAAQPVTFTTSTELVIPVGRPVKVLLESEDVLHAFWVPQLAGKRDAVPGRRDGGFQQNAVWFEATTPGRYEGQCAELCGTWHAGMRFTVIAVEEPAYRAWALAMAEPASAPTDAASPEGQAFAYSKALCATCHMIDLVGSDGRPVTETLTAARIQSDPGILSSAMGANRGPNLTRVASRGSFAGGMFEMNDDNLRKWLTHADAMKPGTRMNIAPQDPVIVENLMAFLKSLALDPAVVDPIHAVGPQDVPNDLDGFGTIGGEDEHGEDEHGADDPEGEEGDSHSDALAAPADTHLESTLKSTLERTR